MRTLDTRLHDCRNEMSEQLVCNADVNRDALKAWRELVISFDGVGTELPISLRDAGNLSRLLKWLLDSSDGVLKATDAIDGTTIVGGIDAPMIDSLTECWNVVEDFLLHGRLPDYVSVAIEGSASNEPPASEAVLNEVTMAARGQGR